MYRPNALLRCLAVAVLLMASGIGTAAGLPQDGLVPAYYAAINRGDYRAAANLVDRNSAEALQAGFNRLLITENAAGEHRLLESVFGPGANMVDGLRADPLTFYEHALRLRYRRMAEGKRTPSQIDVLGHVREHADVVHIVFREVARTETDLTSTPRVMTVRENRDGWRLMVPYEMWASLEQARAGVARYVADRLGKRRSDAIQQPAGQ